MSREATPDVILLYDELKSADEQKPQKQPPGRVINLNGPIVLVDAESASEKLRTPHSASYSLSELRKNAK